MTRPPQHDLFVSERPVRSDYAREKSYAIRRVTTMLVLLSVVGGVGYVLFGRGASTPADIPTIKADGAYKQKPADPGGIDIPHQDVRVYDQLESKQGGQPQVEHLLPPPEVPQAVARPAPAPPQTTPAPEVVTTAPVPTPAPVASTPRVAPPPKAAPTAPVTDAVLSDPHMAKKVDTTVAAAVSVPTVAPKTENVTIDQILARTKAEDAMPAVLPAPKPVTASGHVMIQLASVPDQAQAQNMAKTLQNKYAARLGGAVLRVVRANLGSKGVHYRIQSQGLADSEANRICSSLKSVNAGCILVRQ